MIFDTGSDIAWLPLPGSGAVITFNNVASSTFNNTSVQNQIQVILVLHSMQIILEFLALWEVMYLEYHNLL